MKQFKIIIAMVLLISSIILLAINFFSAQPIQIMLETGQEITAQNAELFSLTKVLILVASSFFVGATSIYLYYESEKSDDDVMSVLRFRRKRSGSIPDSMHGTTASNSMSSEDAYNLISPFLKPDEKKAMLALNEKNGEMLQNELVLRTGLSKVRITRVLSSLQSKNLIRKDRHGLTNKISFVR